MATVQSWPSLRPCTTLSALPGSSRAHEWGDIRLESRSRAAKKWRGQRCSGIAGVGLESRGFGFPTWRSVGKLPESLVSRSVFTEADGDLSALAIWCCKSVLSVAVALIINFMPWNADTAIAQTEVEGSRCGDVSQYYSQASGLQGAKLKAKLHEIVAGHEQLSYAQVWNALKILDAADTATPDTSPDIVDIYSLKRLPKSLQGSIDGWNREHLWPRSYGLMVGRPEFSDVHNLRPADVNVNSSRGNKYFGDCSSQTSTRCLIPANKEAGADTATDVNSWRPPSQVRGDIARAVFYMAVRYGIEQPSGSLNLQLSDSPSVKMATMGLLSTLLEWNELDPPSSSEVLRNARVCSMFQGNRNPFVDHPEYAAAIWAAPADATRPTVPAGPGNGNGNRLPNAWINELHYTNKGKDEGEFIEVVVAPETGVSSLKLYLYDTKGTVYRKLNLADATLFRPSNVRGSRFVLYAAELRAGSIQNGPGDAIALVVEPKGGENGRSVVQFLSYRGVATAVEGPAKGLESEDIGVKEGRRSPVDGSLGLSGAGRAYKDFKWTVFGSGAASPGGINSGQVIN